MRSAALRAGSGTPEVSSAIRGPRSARPASTTGVRRSSAVLAKALAVRSTDSAGERSPTRAEPRAELSEGTSTAARAPPAKRSKSRLEVALVLA